MRWHLILLLIFITTNVYAYRPPRPPTITYPIDEVQINQLNEYLKQISFVLEGRTDLDIVTTSKSNASNGEIWFLQTGNQIRLQIKGANDVFTISPDRY